MNIILTNQSSTISNPVANGDIKGLHILKFLSIIMVVGLHTRMPFNHDLLVQYCRVGVPIFFMISGYFTIKEDRSKTLKGLQRSIVKIAKLSFLANVVYLCWYLLWDGIAGLITIEYVIEKTVGFIKNFLLWGSDYGGHLWYLTTFLHVLIIYWIFCKLKIEKFLWFIVPVGLILNFINGRYCGLFYGMDYEPGFFAHRNVFTTGLPFFIIGGWLRKQHFDNVSSWVGYCGIALLLVVQYLEYRFLCSNDIAPIMGDLNITTVPLSILLFIMGTKWTCNSVFAAPLVLWGREYTMHIYTWHLLFYFVYRTLSSYVPIFGEIPSFVFVYGCAFVLAILLCNRQSFLTSFRRLWSEKWSNFRKFANSKYAGS